MVELVALVLIGGIGVVFLFVCYLKVTAENRKLKKAVRHQNTELNELRRLMIALDTGDNMQELLREVHQHAVQAQELESLSYPLR